jgi:tRNA (guanine-N7-)-methyltransferase
VVELIPESYVAALDLAKIFGRIAPLQVDLGCGDASFLCALAGCSPEKNFLGIERLTGRFARACRKAGPSRTGGKLDNVRLLHLETSYAIRYLLPEASVETFYLLFPDPWPKRRHHCRRIVTPDFLDAIYRALEPNGILRIVTDHLDYFREIEQLAGDVAEMPARKLDGLKPSSCSRFKIVDLDDVDLPATKFERRFRAAGAPIYRIALRKVSPVI